MSRESRGKNVIIGFLSAFLIFFIVLSFVLCREIEKLDGKTKVAELKLYLIERENADLKAENKKFELVVREWDVRITKLEAIFGGVLFQESLNSEYSGIGGPIE